MTHFACADVEGGVADESLAEQLVRFDAAIARVRRAGHQPKHRHAANSAALLRGGLEGARLDAVRPGIALFGVAPLGAASRVAIDLRPTMRVRSEIVSLRTIEAGDSVGYGSTFRASRTTTVATVPIGYADGLPRALSNVGEMLVRGRRAKIVGAVSMDLAALDVTDVAGVSMRDEVVALGEQRGPLGNDAITVEEIASKAGIIAWDVMTSISRRVPRFYREA
jgi:alanine racemase